MGNKKVIIKEEGKFVRRVKPAFVAKASCVLLSLGIGFTGGAMAKNMEKRVNDIETDFRENNQSYKEYFLDKYQDIEDEYTSGEMSFSEYMERKSSVAKENLDTYSLINSFADEETKKDYKKARDSRSAVYAQLVSGLVAGCGFGVSVATDLKYGIMGIMNDKYKTKKKKYYIDESDIDESEEDMER